MGFYATDEILLIRSTKDPTYGNETTTQTTIRCRIEDTNRLIRGVDGKSIEARSLLMLPPGAPVSKGDRIQITKKFFQAVSQPREFEIIETFTAGGFSASHIEAYI